MKTIFALASTFVSFNAMASSYPIDYCHQNVRVIHDGPALCAHVGSGCEELEVIGYKANGKLANSNPEFIDAVITTRCDNDTNTFVVRLGRA